MINKFKLISINDVYEVDEGKLYILNLKGDGKELFDFGSKFDGEDYSDNCWLLEIIDRDLDSIEEIFYVTSDGVKEKYCDITPEFRKYILKELDKIKGDWKYKIT